MSLSSNSLLHFTRDFKSLKSILSQTFKVRYCREKIWSSDRYFDIVVPMVSFCDIPFSQVMHHIKSYSYYGIGLTKEWALKMGLTPVIYIEKQSNLGGTFFSTLFDHVNNHDSTITGLNDKNRQLIDIIRYVKNYQGDCERMHGKKLIKDYRFSDEREWRYVLPPHSANQLYGNCNDLHNDHKQIQILKDELNLKIQYEYLHFGPEDIKYIIIRHEKERDRTIEAIRQIKEIHGELLVSRIASRIISVEQIKGDY
jgi:hypothetical protein